MGAGQVEADYPRLVADAVPLGGGALGESGDATDRIVIYVAAFALPVFLDSLDVIPTIGPWVNQVLDDLATGIQGMAVAIFVVAKAPPVFLDTD